MSDEVIQFAKELAFVIDQKGGTQIKVLDIRGISGYSDAIILATGSSTTTVQAISDYVANHCKSQGYEVLGIEGLDAPEWILIDCNDIVVHLFIPSARAFYDIDALWLDAKDQTPQFGPHTA